MALISISQLTKTYGGCRALSNVDMELQQGEIRGLCGENGAGKSTLIKCLVGGVVPDSGSVKIGGKPISFGRVRESEAAGISVIHQESTALPDLDATDNIFVGRELTTHHGWKLDHSRMRAETVSLLGRLGQSFDTRCPLGELSIANRQMVAMARALSQDCRFLVLDEPTASLSARETNALLEIVRTLRDAGVTILYVSHRLEEIFALADRVTVLRDGELVETRDADQLDRPQLIKLMVGRHVDHLSRPSSSLAGTTPVLEIEKLTRTGAFQDVSLAVRSGEVVGLAGLIGAGRSEVARAVFGIDAYDSGTVKIAGRRLASHDPQAAVAAGVGLVPEDRQHEGLVLPMPVRTNFTFAILNRLTRFGVIDIRSERKRVTELISRLQVKASDQDFPAQTLSGGNQQKIVLGKWLGTDPKLLLLDEPTRGVDVGAKEQVHHLIRQLAADGMATLVISSELPELLSLCDRILVMRAGRIAAEFSAEEATEDRILQAAFPPSDLVSESASDENSEDPPA